MRIIFVLALIVVVANLSGCGEIIDVREGPAPGVRVLDSRAPNAGIQMNTVVILDKSLQQWQGSKDIKKSKIAVEATDSRRTSTGTLEVWATLRNRTDYALQIEGRTQFFDSIKAPAEGPTAWQRIIMSPNSVATYREYSTKIEGISYYYIEIREAR